MLLTLFSTACAFSEQWKSLLRDRNGQQPIGPKLQGLRDQDPRAPATIQHHYHGEWEQFKEELKKCPEIVRALERERAYYIKLIKSS